MTPGSSWLLRVLLGCSTFGALACAEPEAEEGPSAPRLACDAEGNLVQKATAVLPSCYSNVVYGPDDERLNVCRSGAVRPVCGAHWWPGEPTPAGPYECTCNRAGNRSDAYLMVMVDVADAGSCESALETACPFDPEEPPRCKQPGLGGCGPVRGERGRWTCQCEGSEQLHDVLHESCDTALSLTCAAP